MKKCVFVLVRMLVLINSDHYFGVVRICIYVLSADGVLFLSLRLCGTVPNRVRVAVRLRPRNAEELQADVDFADCVELQPEVIFGLS